VHVRNKYCVLFLRDLLHSEDIRSEKSDEARYVFCRNVQPESEKEKFILLSSTERFASCVAWHAREEEKEFNLFT